MREGKVGAGASGGVMRDDPERGRRAGRTSDWRGGKKKPAGRAGRTAHEAPEEERPETLQTQYNRDDGCQQCEQGGRYHFLTSSRSKY